MKICIWCRQDETTVTFNNRAHTMPSSLGGKNICENVCDECNHFFGSKKPNLPSSEIVLKEMLNISKFLLLNNIKAVPKNIRYKTEYFNVNWDNFKIRLKPGYSIKPAFQKKLGTQFRKGMYKVFLEERERQKHDALDDRFNFIREFARYGLGDYPMYIQLPKFKAIFAGKPDLINPELRFSDHWEEIDKEYRVFGFPIFGHNFLIPTSPYFDEFCRDNFLRYLKSENHPCGTEIQSIEYAEDIDYTFRFMSR